MQRKILSTEPYYPRLPDLIQPTSGHEGEALAEGAYLLRMTFDPEFQGQKPTRYEGTFRVHYESPGSLQGSGDLYFVLRREDWTEPPSEDSNYKIPTFPHLAYEAYLSLQELQCSTSLRLRLEVTRLWKHPARWEKQGLLDAVFPCPEPTEAEPSGPLHGHLYEGARPVGQIEMRWLGPWLRECAVQVDWEGNREPPDWTNDWKILFDQVGWRATAERGACFNMPEDSTSKNWKRWHLRNRLALIQQGVAPDPRWRYHLLVVGDIASASWGLMFDTDGVDSFAYREGAALGADEEIEEAEGSVSQPRLHLQIPRLFFHTAAHETGHAAGLQHEHTGRATVMMETKHLREVLGGDYPDNTPADFSTEGHWLLRHLPDPLCRPGGLKAAPGFAVTRQPVVPLEGLVLKLHMEDLALPLAAPLRLTLELISETESDAPSSDALHSTSRFVEGRVWGPSGEPRYFGATGITESSAGLELLEEKKSRIGDMTILQGLEGPLMPVPGPYRVEVALRWRDVHGWRSLHAVHDFEVTPALTPDHQEAAAFVLNTPGARLARALSSEKSLEEADLIELTTSSKALRNHWNVFGVLRSLELGRPLEAEGKLDEKTIMTGHESAQVAMGFVEAGLDPEALLKLRDASRILGRSLSKLEVPVSPSDAEIVKELQRRVEKAHAG